MFRLVIPLLWSQHNPLSGTISGSLPDITNSGACIHYISFDQLIQIFLLMWPPHTVLNLFIVS